MFIVDSHCHLDALDYQNLHKNITDVVEKARARDVKHLLAIGVTLSRFEQAYSSLCEFENISLACGVHPLDFEEEPYDAERLLRLAQDKKVIAIGEIGLDYYYSADNKTEQQAVFASQIDIANRLAKPVIIHTRSAANDTLALLRENHAEKCGGVIHCFTETLEFAKKVLDLGFYISCSGIVTFKNAESIREAIRYVPVDRLLVETDSPYLAPVPYRGKENQPAYTREVCEYVATLKGLSTASYAESTTRNYERLFKIRVE